MLIQKLEAVDFPQVPKKVAYMQHTKICFSLVVLNMSCKKLESKVDKKNEFKKNKSNKLKRLKYFDTGNSLASLI